MKVTKLQQVVLDFLRTCPGASYAQVAQIEESGWVSFMGGEPNEMCWQIGRGAASSRLKALERKGLVEAIRGIDGRLRWSPTPSRYGFDALDDTRDS